MELMLGKRLKAAWNAFRRPMPMIDPEIATQFPEVSTEFRQRGNTALEVRDAHRSRPGFFR